MPSIFDGPKERNYSFKFTNRSHPEEVTVEYCERNIIVIKKLILAIYFLIITKQTVADKNIHSVKRRVLLCIKGYSLRSDIPKWIKKSNRMIMRRGHIPQNFNPISQLSLGVVTIALISQTAIENYGTRLCSSYKSSSKFADKR